MLTEMVKKENKDIISAEGIMKYLVYDSEVKDRIFVYNELESTNSTAQALLHSGAEHGTVVIADSQTMGRGRFSRQFFSPEGSGLYVSFILDTAELNFSSPTLVTAYAAVKVCNVLEKICGVSCGVKWVNDIIVEGRKAAGILAEGVADQHGSGIGYIILGIGINIYTEHEDFPPDIRDKSISLCPGNIQKDLRNRIAAELIRSFSFSTDIDEEELISEYRSRLVMLGEKICVKGRKPERIAEAIDINNEGELLVKYENGDMEYLNSGEISTDMQEK